MYETNKFTDIPVLPCSLISCLNFIADLVDLLTFCMLFCPLLNFFLKILLGIPYSLDLDWTRHFVGPDLGSYCFRKLSADDTSK